MDVSQQAAASTAPGMRKRGRESDTAGNALLQQHNDDQYHMMAFETLDMLQAATQHLASADPRLAGLITEFGPPERLLTKNDSCFRSLAKSILYQQLAGTAAAAIFSRFLAVCGVPESQLHPSAVLSVSPAELRACGLSERKASYLLDLAAHFQDGRLSDQLLTSLSDEALLSTLTAVRGIGPWTVDMFSMFHLGRPNILPVGDLGVRKGIAHLCGLSHLPSPAEMEQLTASWQPYRSVGCYYMWRIPLPPNRKAAAAAAAAAGKGKQYCKGGSSKVKAKSNKGGRKGAAAAAAAVTSPLGPAAVAAAFDVGVDAAAPLLAAAHVDGVHVVTGTVQGSSSACDVALAAAVGDTCTAEEQQQQDLLEQVTPAKQQQQQRTTAIGETAAALSGMMTRRRLNWRKECSRQQSSAAEALIAPEVATAVQAGTSSPVDTESQCKLRVVDLG